MIATILNTQLELNHYEHLISEGFTPDQIEIMEKFGVCSITKTQALRDNFKVWNKPNYESSSGLKFPFTPTFSQLRCDNPPLRNGKKTKYLTPMKAKSEAMLPEDWQVVTEGAKDAWAGTLHGGIPTGAIAGVSHFRNALEPLCGGVILFDSDGWSNPQVAANLLESAKWTGGKIQLIPPVTGEPKAGLCEYFKAGATPEDYAKLIDQAMWPEEFLYSWANRWDTLSPAIKSRCLKVAIAQTNSFAKAG